MKTIIKFATATATALVLFGSVQAGPPGKGYPGSGSLRTTRGGMQSHQTAVRPAICADCGATQRSATCPADGRMTCNGCRKGIKPALGDPSGKHPNVRKTDRKSVV